MHLAKSYVVIVLVLTVLCFETDGQKACSCYSFEGGATGGKSWPEAKTSCEDQKKHLVAMETEREWEFIKNQIQNRTSLRDNKWLIGLMFRNSKNACWRWTWVNGQPLTIDRWMKPVKDEPDPGDLYSLIAKDFPRGTYGLFAGITKSVYREWICEEETDNCTGTCMYHNLVPTTATSTRRTTPATIETTSSAIQDHTDLSESTSSGGETTPGKRDVTESTSSGGETTPGKNDGDTTGDKGDRTTVIVLAVSLAAVSLIALIALAVVLFLKRKKRRPQDAERPKKKSSNLLEDQNGPILNPENAATQLGLSDTEDGIGSNERESLQRATPSNREYTMLNPLTMVNHFSCTI